MRQRLYDQLVAELHSLISDETDWLANLANTAALLYERLPDVNWAGFYLWRQGQLVLGPFQGKPACVRIPMGRGVCGSAAQQRRPLIVPDVHAFPGHIACDAASRSEIVLPWLAADRLVGVLDIDSPLLNRFDSADAAGLAKVIELVTVHALPPPFEG